MTLCRWRYIGGVNPAVGDLDLTPKMAAVIKIFLEDTRQPRYGAELMCLAGQPSGTLYPILAKFERAGWLAGGREDIDPRTAGRPARRFYHITGAGALAARSQLAELSERYRPPAPGGARLLTWPSSADHAADQR
jgi:PadR family transcriptional regulator, regulatory protein PadR